MGRSSRKLAAGPPSEPAGDEADRAFGRVRSAIENDLIDLHLRELTQIEAARERLFAAAP